MTHKLIKTDNYLLVVDDSEIKEGDYWHYIGELEKPFLNNLPTTWFDKLHDKNKYKNVTAHLPLNGSPILEGVSLLPPYSRHQEDGLEDYAQSCNQLYKEWLVTGYKSGYNKAREKYKYTEENVRKAYIKGKHGGVTEQYQEIDDYIQSIHQYPTEFECEMQVVGVTDDGVNTIEERKTITTAQGVQWIGKYK
jgi:hypothetical protein